MTAAKLRHSSLDTLKVADDCVVFAGRPLPTIAEQIGRTPFYAYDRAAIGAVIQSLRAALPRALDIHYAMKANPMPAVVQHVARLVDGLDVASSGELRVALDAGVAAQRISFAGPGKSIAELAQAVSCGITINMESEREVELIAQHGQKQGIRPIVAVRINPDFQMKTSGMKMAGGPAQFGIDAERVPDVLRRIGALGLDFVGFHIFTGSQTLLADAVCEAQNGAAALAVELSEHTPQPIRLLNIGGGFGIPYFPGDKPLSLAPIAQNLHALQERVTRELPTAKVAIELGRYIVGEAGIYVCRVLYRKISRGRVFLITDGGLHHHLAASGNFGQLLRKNYPVVIGNKVRGARREVASVVGPLCTPLDLLADRMDLAEADVGDLVVVLQSGAYGCSASPLAFLSHAPPAEVLL